MEKKKKSAMIRFPVILLAVSAILLSALPCTALFDVPLPSGETTLNVLSYRRSSQGQSRLTYRSEFSQEKSRMGCGHWACSPFYFLFISR